MLFMPTHDRKADVFDLATDDGRVAFQQLVNDPDVRVNDQQTFPMGDGSVLRVVDFSEPNADARPRPVYTPPVC